MESRDREGLRDERFFNEATTALLILTAVLACFKDPEDPSFVNSIHLPKIGGIMVLVGLLGVRTLRRKYFEKVMGTLTTSESPQLLTTGAYSYSRNPLYLSYLSTYLGAALWNPSGPILLLTAIHIVIDNILIRKEEKNLRQIFGEQYEEYCKGVRRWI